MKMNSLIAVFCCFATLPMASGKSLSVYFGTYTGGESISKGIYRSTLDLETGRLSDPVLAAETGNPSFLEIHPNGKFLYAVSEFGGEGSVSAFAIGSDGEALTFLNLQPSGGAGPCHVSIDHAGKNVLVANYSGGSASVIPIQADGSLGKPTGFVQHEGSSVNVKRQKGPHAHSINVSPDDRFAFVADLGIDKIMIYRLDGEKGTIVANSHPYAEVQPGAGPRHFAFHPTGKFAYAINELDGSIASFAYESGTGALTKIQKITTLPADFEETNSCAEVRAHPSGKFVYGSNRGHDSIAVYRADPDTGLLTFVEHETAGVKTPRNFNIDPTGKFCLVGSQGSGSVVVFRIDQETGALEPTGYEISVGRPVCVRFLQAASTPDLLSEHPALKPVVEVEEEVYQYEPAKNGSGPMWCRGSTSLARIGDTVFASGIETLKDFVPLNNCRWMLFQREAGGWRQVQVDPTGRTREPSPVVGFSDGRLFLSVNPTLTTEPDTYSGPARPEILEFAAAEPEAPFKTILPVWDGTPMFTEHSYRSFAADGLNKEMILFQNIGYTHAEWSFRNRAGEWESYGRLEWPWGAEYDKPQPIRVCYPTVALENRAVHFCGVSDIVEPYDKWREFKEEITGRKWDYDFRRLFYAWSPDISTGRFEDWIEIASRDKTCGWITPGDLWVAPDGAAHIVWTERALDERLREKFFPNEVQSHALNYAIVREGKVVTRRTLMLAEEGKSKQIPGLPRFQVTPENRLFVFYYVSGSDREGKPVSENRIMEMRSDGTNGEPVVAPLEFPLTSYFTATVRGGSPRSKTLDLLGPRAGGGGISYARVRLFE